MNRLLGGKVRDRVRVYNGAIRFPLAGHEPRHYADDLARMMALPKGFTIIKQPIGLRSPVKRGVPGFYYGEPAPGAFHGSLDRGPVTERGLRCIIDCVAAMKEVAGDRVGLALDCGPAGCPPTRLASPARSSPTTFPESRTCSRATTRRGSTPASTASWRA